MSTMMLLFFLFGPPSGSSLTGRWATADHSVVEVYACGATQLCVRVVAVGPAGKPATDENNPDPSLRGRAICGLTIASGFTPSGEAEAKQGRIYDPESGKTYSAQMTAQGDTLKLRGFIGLSLLGRTETWHRAAPEVVASCR